MHVKKTRLCSNFLYFKTLNKILTSKCILKKHQNGITALEQQQSINLMEELDVGSFLVLKKENEDGPDVKGGHTDALIIHATRVQKISDGKLA